MPHNCAVVGCSNNSMRDWSKHYYLIPSERDKRGRILEERIKRRECWIQALHRADLTETKIKNMRICSDHFLSGKPAEFGDTTNPDYIPHVKMGYETTNRSAHSVESRHKRLQKRNLNKERALEKKNVEDEPLEHVHVELANLDSRVGANETDKIVQTDISNEEMVNYEKNCIELQYLNEQLYTYKSRINTLVISEAMFEGNCKMTKFYTGLPSFTALMKVFNLVENRISNVSSISKFQQFILTLMHLRIDLFFMDIGYRFNISAQTASRIFYKCLNVLYMHLKSFIIWPEREELIATMPDCFKKNFGNKVTVVIDCFEVKIERSSNLKAQAATWSNYKHHNTIKILIGICPQGAITFISKAYGGRNTDRMITENCGILDFLLPGDLVLADRGFLIQDSVRMRLAEVKIPDFMKNKKQLDPLQIESTRKLANVRIHVERVIGTVRRKYRILGNLLPICTVKKRNLDLNIPVIDQILTVTCALTNLCPSVIN